ncbi:MAG TPA: zinc finger CCHC domain-containing protein, partial [Candidatus Nanoarchaeia archaeon]|nr:zinc finger CCHC domain-containing protein [Candidatus Nanoarchaeia archaeon]
MSSNEKIVAARRSLATATFQDENEKKAIEATITELEAELERLTTAAQAGQAIQQVDLKNPTAVTAFLNRETSFETQRKNLSKQARTEYLSGRLTDFDFRDPSVKEELNYWKQMGKGNEKTDIKALTAIPSFNGESEAAWRAFEMPWLMAVKDRAITEENLKTTLYQRLTGSAATYYLSLPRVQSMSFGEILQELCNKYTSTPFAAQGRVKGMTQGIRESVSDFAARMRVSAKSFYPPEPRELKVLKVAANIEYVIPNPMKAEEEKEYMMQYNRSEAAIASNYLQGLCPEIQMRLNAKKYETLNKIIREAEAAEWMKQSMDQGYLHNIEQVNLLTPRFVKKKTFEKPQADSNQASGFSKLGNTNSRKCYACGEENHFASDCPNKKQAAHRSFQRYSARQQSFQPNRRRFPNKVETMIKPYSRR